MRSPGRSRASGPVLTWSLIGLMLLVVVYEWRAQRGYRKTLAALEQALPDARSRLQRAEADKLVEGWAGRETVARGGRTYLGYHWPSLFREYRIWLDVSGDGQVGAPYSGPLSDLAEVPAIDPPAGPPSGAARGVGGVGAKGATEPAGARAVPPRVNVAPVPAEDRPEAVLTAFRKADKLLMQNRSGGEEFNELLQSIAGSLPRLVLSDQPGTATWNHVQIGPRPWFAAFRVSSVLDEPADLYLMFTCPEPSVHWYILPARGRMSGFSSYRRVRYPDFEDVEIPRHDQANFQSLTGGRIEAGQDYVVWFAVKASQREAQRAELVRQKQLEPDNPSTQRDEAIAQLQQEILAERALGIPLSVAMRLVPAAATPAHSDVLRIAERVGAPLHGSPEGEIIYRGESPVYDVQVLPAGGQLALCDGTGTIRLIDLDSHTVRRELEGDALYSMAAISRDGRRLAAANARSREVSLWDLENGAPLSAPRPEWRGMVSAAPSSAVPDNAAPDIPDDPVKTYEEVLGRIDFSRDPKRFQLLLSLHATAAQPRSSQSEFVLWDITDRREVGQIVLGTGFGEGRLTPDGRQLLVLHKRQSVHAGEKAGPAEYEIAIFDWSSGEQSASIPLTNAVTVSHLAVSSAGTLLGVNAAEPRWGGYRIFDWGARSSLGSVSTTVAGEKMSRFTVQAVAWSSDSRALALALSDSSIRLWNVAERRLCHVWRGHAGTVRALAFTPDGKRVLSSGDDGTVRVWRPEVPPHQVLADSVGMRLVPIAAGEFVMGTPAGYADPGYKHTNYSVERPQHRVRISRPFSMGMHEVTVGQFRAFVEATGYKTTAETNALGGGHMPDPKSGYIQRPQYTWRSPGPPQTDDHPVVQVSWNDALAFCRWLSDREGAVYRLPTEAEWEYACRAGSDRGPWNIPAGDAMPRLEDCFGNIADLAFRRLFPDYRIAADHDDGYAWTAPVGRLRPNDFGLHDMNGNVFEWCADWYDPTYYRVSPAVDPEGPTTGTTRVQRSGGFMHHYDCSRSSYRDLGPPDQVQSELGFRVVREISDAEW